jgi:hypothetical protein
MPGPTIIANLLANAQTVNDFTAFNGRRNGRDNRISHA